MTREEEIRLTADKYCLDEYTRLGFVAGAEWADSHPHWISVDEELPKEGQLCIILIDRKALQGMPRIRSAVYAPNVMMQQEGFAYNRMSKKHHITHWMHLPQAPTCSEKPNNSKKGGEE